MSGETIFVVIANQLLVTYTNL